MAKIGLLGGAFDPIHRGHVAVACQALHTLALDEVRLIPMNAPVHKAPCQASPWQRAAMVALAIQGIPHLRLDTCELQRNTPSYAINTILHIQDQGNHQLSWILGADALLGFTQWHRWSDIVALVDLIVVDRPGCDAQAVDHMIAQVGDALRCHHRHLHRLAMPLQPQASSVIRRRGVLLADVPDLVGHYIQAEGLYGRDPPLA